MGIITYIPCSCIIKRVSPIDPFTCKNCNLIINYDEGVEDGS